ncbi:hypothetical protein ACE3J1_10240 [Enterobacter hormaechei subsp. steigerwaltii]
MTKLTKEIIEEALKKCDAYHGAVTAPVSVDVVRAMARQLLAGLEQEPVGYEVITSTGEVMTLCKISSGKSYQDMNCTLRPVYAAPQLPQPAVAITQHFDTIALDTAKMVMCDVNRRDDFLGGDIQLLSRIQCRIDEACRAAMLQGADRPQNEPQNIPENIPENIPATQFKPVADLYGLTSPTGGETSFTFDAVEARDFIDGGWSCQEYVELGRFQEAMLQNGNSPAQSDCCPEQNYIAPAQDGNSPVIPDGWVLVPEEPTHEMLEAGDEQFGTYDVYRRMIEAAPKLE